MNIKIGIKTDKVGSEAEEVIEVDDEEWESMNEFERDEYILTWIFEMGLADYYFEKQ